jgi:repressor LexA
MLKTQKRAYERTAPLNDAGYAKWRDGITAFVRSYWQEQGYSPSIRDIQEGLQASSTSVVEYRLRQMRDKGDIQFDFYVSRSFRLPGQKVVFE